jgi:hypothetical protein
MSYAGRASRTPRAPNPNAPMELIASPARPKALPVPPRRRSPSYASNDDRSSVFLAGLAMGLAVGAGVVLLLAPQTGEEARHSIRRMTRRVGRRGHDAWDDLRDELRRYRRKSARRREASSL